MSRTTLLGQGVRWRGNSWLTLHDVQRTIPKISQCAFVAIRAKSVSWNIVSGAAAPHSEQKTRLRRSDPIPKPVESPIFKSEDWRLLVSPATTRRPRLGWSQHVYGGPPIAQERASCQGPALLSFFVCCFRFFFAEAIAHVRLNEVTDVNGQEECIS